MQGARMGSGYHMKYRNVGLERLPRGHVAHCPVLVQDQVYSDYLLTPRIDLGG